MRKLEEFAALKKYSRPPWSL